MSLLNAHSIEIDSALTLSQAEVGCEFQIKALSSQVCQQLREIGFCEEMRIRKISNGRNLICTLCGTRLALSKKLAEHITVAPLN